MARTKKVGITGRFGARYGRKAKRTVKSIEENMKKDHDYQKLSNLLNEIVDLGLAALTQFTDLKPTNDDMLFITELTKQKKKRAKKIGESK